MTGHGYAALEINPIKMLDKGEYTVMAVNTLGEARKSAIIDVIGQSVSLSFRRSRICENNLVTWV